MLAVAMPLVHPVFAPREYAQIHPSDVKDTLAPVCAIKIKGNVYTWTQMAFQRQIKQNLCVVPRISLALPCVFVMRAFMVMIVHCHSMNSMLP